MFFKKLAKIKNVVQFHNFMNSLQNYLASYKNNQKRIIQLGIIYSICFPINKTFVSHVVKQTEK